MVKNRREGERGREPAFFVLAPPTSYASQNTRFPAAIKRHHTALEVRLTVDLAISRRSRLRNHSYHSIVIA